MPMNPRSGRTFAFHSARAGRMRVSGIWMRAKRLAVALFALVVAGLSGSALAGADWSAPVNLSEAGQDADQHQVAIDADGDAVFTWVRFDGSRFRVQAQARAADGTLSSVKALSSGGQDAYAPQVAVGADGDAVFTWQRSDGTDIRVQARARAADGTLSSVQTLSDAGQDASEPQVGIDTDGDA